MKGSTCKRKLPSGKIDWMYSIDAGKDHNGKRVRIFKSGFKSKAAADDALRVKLNEKADGDLVAPDPQSFNAFAEEWFREYAHRRCSPKTLERYRELAAYILPILGSTKLQSLTALMLERVLNHLKDCGGHTRKDKKPRPLSAKTVKHIAGVVNVMLKKAIKLKLLKSNPMEGVELPPVPYHEARWMDADRVQRYVEAARRHGLYDLLMFYAGTSCRRGEALAVTWYDLDLDYRNEATISKSLEQTRAGLRVKSTKGGRTKVIALSASLVEVLKFHREQQSENRRMFGPAYRTDLDLVFCLPDGNYLKPDSVTSKGCLISREAGLEKGISLHTFRHSQASQMLSDGASPVTVSKRLGHSNVQTTMNIYAHVIPRDDRKAADLWDEQFQKAATKSVQ